MQNKICKIHHHGEMDRANHCNCREMHWSAAIYSAEADGYKIKSPNRELATFPFHMNACIVGRCTCYKNYTQTIAPMLYVLIGRM